MFYAFLPFCSAAVYGLSYVLLDRLLKSAPIIPYMLASSVFFTAVIACAAFIKRHDFSLSFLSDRKLLLLFAVNIVVGAAGWMITLISLKKTTASYTAFAEISYPLFTILFMFLIFGVRQFNWTSALGAALIFVGSLVLIAAQNAITKP